MTARASTRDIARAAIRADLAQVAHDMFVREGFDNVTINDLALAAGVSRSTFLRYFNTKEEAALVAFDDQGEQVAAALDARPHTEDDWTALRRSLDIVIDRYRRDPGGSLALACLVQQTPALSAKQLEKQSGWRPALVAALQRRWDRSPHADMRASVLAAAAMDCLNIAVDRWTSSRGELDLENLVDEAFQVLAHSGVSR